MRLYLAVAVLVLAFVAYTGRLRFVLITHLKRAGYVFIPSYMSCNSLSLSIAEAQEETIEQRFSKFGEQMTQFGDDLAEKTKAAITQIHNSDFAVSSR